MTIYLVSVTQTKQEFIGKTEYTKYFKANGVHKVLHAELKTAILMSFIEI